jgi:hypothetical protein
MSRLPVNISHADLVAILTDILARVKTGDSYEGYVSWTLPFDNAAPDRSFDVIAGYRTGNLGGQGGMRIIDGGPAGDH